MKISADGWQTSDLSGALNWKIQLMPQKSHQSISGLLTEAIGDFVRKRRLRPVVLDHLEKSISENEELGKRLAE